MAACAIPSGGENRYGLKSRKGDGLLSLTAISLTPLLPGVGGQAYLIQQRAVSLG
jgi:hypothetical protein